MNTRSTLTYSPGAAGPVLKEAAHWERPPEWTEFALCAEVGAELFFPEQGESAWPAKTVCASCDVKRPCLLRALDLGQPYGVWGGLTELERRRLGPSPSPRAIDLALSRVGRKRCRDCRTWKLITRFPLKGDGVRHSACKDCVNRADRERRGAA